MWRNNIKCKNMFVFPLKNLTRKGLRNFYHWYFLVPQWLDDTITQWDISWFNQANIDMVLGGTGFGCIQLNTNIWILIKVLLRSVSISPIDKNRSDSDNCLAPTTIHFRTRVDLVYWRVYCCSELNDWGSRANWCEIICMLPAGFRLLKF